VENNVGSAWRSAPEADHEDRLSTEAPPYDNIPVSMWPRTYGPTLENA
jgi:hypothetical protein